MLVHTWSDGSARPNPGKISAGAIVKDLNGNTLARRGRALGHGTNNVAEWHGLLLALEAAAAVGATRVLAHLDSALVVGSMQNDWNTSDHLVPLRDRARELAATFESVEYKQIPREINRAADAICTAVYEGTYNGDDDELLDADPTPANIRVAFLVEVDADPNVVREALKLGSTPRSIRSALAKRIESSLIRAAQAGDTVRVSKLAG